MGEELEGTLLLIIFQSNEVCVAFWIPLAILQYSRANTKPTQTAVPKCPYYTWTLGIICSILTICYLMLWPIKPLGKNFDHLNVLIRNCIYNRRGWCSKHCSQILLSILPWCPQRGHKTPEKIKIFVTYNLLH